MAMRLHGMDIELSARIQRTPHGGRLATVCTLAPGRKRGVVAYSRCGTGTGGDARSAFREALVSLAEQLGTEHIRRK